MKRIEIAGLGVIFLLVVYRVIFGMELHILLRVATTLLAIFYMWFGIYIFNEMGLLDILDRNKRRLLSTFRIIFSITGGFIYSFSLITLVFAIDFYGNMDLMLVLSLVLNSIILGWSLFYLKVKKAELDFVKQFYIRSGFFVILFFAIWITPLESRLNTLYKDHPSFIEAYKYYLENQDNPEALQRLREERSAFRY